MQLSTLVQDLPSARVLGDAGVEVRRVREDSRQVEPGDLFVAVRGLRADGHDYAADAAARGAAAAVVEREIEGLSVPQVVVEDAARALGILTARAFGRPGDRMRVVGITGTNGKTTTTYLVESIVAAAGGSPGVLGTVSYRYAGEEHEAPYTTPTPEILHRVLGDMQGKGVTHAVLEVSSAALGMERLAGLDFTVGAFTNLTQDHLDLHGSMEAYRAAKEKLFSDVLAPDGVAVVNADDAASAAMIRAAGDHRVLRVSTRADADADVRVVESSATIEGVEATLATPRGELRLGSRFLLGTYNVQNLALAAAVGEALELPHRAIAEGVRAMGGVPGRVERVENGAGLSLLVDYAHTPDALSNVLAGLRPITPGRLLCIFGCGGDRDPGKRPKMGAAVAELADLAIVTSDNPRTEDPQAILEQILPAVPEPFFVDVDRRTAIRAAVWEATPNDVVLIAGKGHEDYQILGTEKIHFDDREEAAEAARLRETLSVEEVIEATGGTVRGDAGVRFSRIVIDGRTAAPGDLYVAIRGERHDGHDFCAQALERGAAGVLVAEGAEVSVPEGSLVLEVPDPREALGALARLHRRRWGAGGGRVVGVTGSAGKTTTKDLLAAALSAEGRVLASQGSLNNETGVPLTLLRLRPLHDFAVVEMGMRGLGQIDELCRIAEPEVGVVVNAGSAHVGVVGSVEAIARGKGEIFPGGGVAVHPAGDPRLAESARRAARRVTFGEEENADVRLTGYQPLGAEGARATFEVEGRRVEARIPIAGRHNAQNAACALAAAVALGVEPERAAAGLAGARPAAMRGEILEAAGRRIFFDCYNANPASMAAALATVAELRGDRSALAVVGDMLELGDEAREAHREVGRRAAELDVGVVALGERAGDVTEGAGGGRVAADPEEAARLALAATGAGDWILVKASRGMKLERVLEAMRKSAAE